MSRTKLLRFHITLLLSSFISKADGYYAFVLQECLYSYPDLSDLVCLESYSFNKVLHLQFNSTVGKFVGYTEKDRQQAKALNENPKVMQLVKANMELCKYYKKLGDKVIFNKVVKPKVMLSLVKWDQDKHSILMCSAYDFYPEQIKVSWLRDGKPMTSDMTSTLEMADGDWYYQIHSHLEYTPKSGETISCMVEHASSTKPLIYNWAHQGWTFRDTHLEISVATSSYLSCCCLLIS
ncbi:H-2 class II histocompatibility antigen, E-D beta chain isoform X2 [Labeo rohita]|uniref:H-2 class II histocompatibility antigen, E-D beta chain isoform X2 n=1 Tax=Labeo rohita TaxID=84645 RepID=UPI0021E33A2E|nr:H-2 class II histocompatibility antigen, E-D beta chain isoform X2 [Labeo rohita]